MRSQQMNQAILECRSADGRVVAQLRLYTTEPFAGGDARLAPMVQIEPQAAKHAGEAAIQLRENGRYEYLLEPSSAGLRVQCTLAKRSARCAPNEDHGVIETGAHCGLLRIDVVRSDGAVTGTGYVEVRSVKLGYRDQYRAMLNDISARVTEMLFDARSSSQAPLAPVWRDEPRFLQQQIEFLRETLESPAFHAAMQRVIDFPHRQLAPEIVTRPIGQSLKHGRDLARHIGNSASRISVSRGHALFEAMRARGVAQPSLPERIAVTKRTDDLDTLENQFVQFILHAFRDFLDRAAKALRKCDSEWHVVADRAGRTQQRLDQFLTHRFFTAIAPLRAAPPIGSPALQRKPGYREILQAWVRFEANARLSWEAADEIFHAGVRDVATLYEYWLFFQLLDWFCVRFDGARISARQLIEPAMNGVTLKLKQGVMAGPFEGIYARNQRRLQAQFHYNRRFNASPRREAMGSWSRAMQPDFTLSLWPADYSLEEAEAQELAVHLHFDAKYRVDSLEALFGQSADEAAEAAEAADAEMAPSNGRNPQKTFSYKRADLLKMHAYRDAIRRSEGAYVLYPGGARDVTESRFLSNVMFGFDEILPSLGAFSVAPGMNGSVQGMAHLSAFLDAVLEHVSNRATQREQRAYHAFNATRIASYRTPVVPRQLHERDEVGNRAAPPHEHLIVVASDEPEAIEWMLANGRVVLSLGDRHHALQTMKQLATASHVVLRSPAEVRSGLLRLLDQAALALTREDLAIQGYPFVSDQPESESIFAVFKVEADPAYRDWRWDGAKLDHAMAAFERRHKLPFVDLVSTPLTLRIVSLGDLIAAATPAQG